MKYINLLFMAVIVICFSYISPIPAQNIPMNADLSACGSEPTCEWDFGDGVNATGCKSKEHNYGQPGNYTVTMAMECGQASQSSTRQVKVKANHSWQTGDWSPTEGCGETTQTRNVYCIRNSDNVTVDDSFCVRKKPKNSRIVNLENDCLGCNYEYNYDEQEPIYGVQEGDVQGDNIYVFYWDEKIIGHNDQDSFESQEKCGSSYCYHINNYKDQILEYGDWFLVFSICKYPKELTFEYDNWSEIKEIYGSNN